MIHAGFAYFLSSRLNFEQEAVQEKEGSEKEKRRPTKQPSLKAEKIGQRRRARGFVFHSREGPRTDQVLRSCNWRLDSVLQLRLAQNFQVIRLLSSPWGKYNFIRKQETFM